MSSAAKQPAALFLSQLVDQNQQRLAVAMPTEVDAIRQFVDALQRLEDLGWRRPELAPRNTQVLVVSAHSISGRRYKARRLEVGWQAYDWFHWDGLESWRIVPVLWRPLLPAERESGQHHFGLDYRPPQPQADAAPNPWLDSGHADRRGRSGDDK